MRERDRLERALTGLAGRVDYPATPPIVPTVTARLSARRPAGSRRALAWLALWTRRRLLVAVAIAILAVLALAAAARVAIGAFQIRVAPDASASSSASPLDRGDLGVATTLEDAARLAHVPIRVPDGPPPNEAYVVDGPLGQDAVAAMWRATATSVYPPIEGTPWSLVVMAFEGDVEIAVKTVARVEDVRDATVGGARAFWIPVAHELTLRTADGDATFAVRGNVLLWRTPDGLTYRLETSLPRDDAVALAETIR